VAYYFTTNFSSCGRTGEVEEMPDHTLHTPEMMQGQPEEPVRNPYILNFCKVLVEKKGEELEPEALKTLLEEMYRVYEYMLGQNMINNLPDDVRKEYLKIAEDLGNLNYEKIGEIFDKNIQNYEQIMKDTMKQFAEIYMKNRIFDPKQYEVLPRTE
jgi:DNA-directed RNA polymerase specialized sigma24 family protein